MPPDDILLNKAAIIERCVRRMLEETRSCPRLDDFTHVDALTLNIERACQAAIDMAMHIVADRHLGIPQSTADAFVLRAVVLVGQASLSPADESRTGFSRSRKPAAPARAIPPA